MSKTYDSHGAKLSYWETGVGLPVLFLHPTPLDHVYWRPMIAELGEVRAIVPDFRGHGASELGADLPVGGFARVPDAPVLSMGQLAADVLALMDHLALSEAVFVGCSIGGYVMLEVVAQGSAADAGFGNGLLEAAGGCGGQPGKAGGDNCEGAARGDRRCVRWKCADADRCECSEAAAGDCGASCEGG